MTTKFDIREQTFEFALAALRCCRQVQHQDGEFILTKQLSRSATSVGANIREARNAESKRDFIHKMSIAQKECDESLYWLELLLAFVSSEKSELVQLEIECSQILKILRTIIVKTKENSNWEKR